MAIGEMRIQGYYFHYMNIKSVCIVVILIHYTISLGALALCKLLHSPDIMLACE